MLPKVSFTDTDTEENGSSMLSRFGKMTAFNHPILRGAIDPIVQHNRFMANIEAKHPLNIDPAKGALAEEQQSNLIKDNSMRSKTDLDAFMKRINQQKSLVFTAKAKPASKITMQPTAQEEVASGEGMPLPDTAEVDIEAQVEAAKQLLKTIQMRNQAADN